ncbi:MAG: hypothetical protein K0Q62_444, partial [Phenylobacterium sp.]|nr:hypothetical protein [Phenylobacterium sp.]
SYHKFEEIQKNGQLQATWGGK